MNSKMSVRSCVVVFVLCLFFTSLEAQLKVGFYSTSCPIAEYIVRQEVAKAYFSNKGIAPGLVRLHFHDCFVRGCDASVLIDSTTNNVAEKDSPANNPSLRGFEVIESAKTIIESFCNRTVSCADILAFAARDSIVITNGPYYEVEAGRRDGRVSLASEVLQNLPGPTFTVDQLIQNFQRKNLTYDEMVTLSGTHTIGRSHCTTITQVNDRLYNFNGTNNPDPTLESGYASTLRNACPQASTDTKSIVSMDPQTPIVTDVKYYSNILAKKGLFTSDQTLMTNTATATAVYQNAFDQTLWFNKLKVAMVNMGKIEVLTGNAGEIRKKCSVINY